MRCVTWNVNGIRAVLRKEIHPWSAVPDGDVVCLQETKAQPEQLTEDVLAPEGWHSYWHSAEKKGYSGVAIYTREAADEVITGMGDEDVDREGRVLGVRFGDRVFVSAYFPNSQDAGKRLDYKLAFCAGMERYLARLRDAGLKVLLTGDYNIAHRPIDLARPKQNEKNPGYLPEERAWFSRFVDLGYVDLFRALYPDAKDAYSWWSYRANARARNIGWRIDYVASCPQLREDLIDVHHHPEVLGSDHCPVSVDLR